MSVRTVWRLIRAERVARYRRRGDRRTFVDLEQMRSAVGFRRVSGPKPGADPPASD